MSTIEHYPAKKSAPKLLCLPLYPNELSTDLKKRSNFIQSILDQFDMFSQVLPIQFIGSDLELLGIYGGNFGGFS